VDSADNDDDDNDGVKILFPNNSHSTQSRYVVTTVVSGLFESITL